MLFALSKLLWWIARPSLLLVLVTVLGVLLSRRRAGRIVALIGAMPLLAAALMPVGSWLQAPLEDRFPPVREVPSHVDGIVVLGGTIEPALTRAHGMPALNDSAERFTAFVALARRFPDAKLIFSGGSGSLVPGGTAEADIAKPLLADLGLDPARILFDRDSRNTYENAVDARRLADPQPRQVWVLITSAAHMPRAVGCFRRAGWSVLPWPVGYKTGVAPFGNPGPGLAMLDNALHEWLGLAAYRLLGRTDALFPAP